MRVFSDRHRANLAAAAKRRAVTEERLAVLRSNAAKKRGVAVGQEVLQRMTAAQQHRWADCSDADRKRHVRDSCGSRSGAKQSAETRAKISASLKLAYSHERRVAVVRPKHRYTSLAKRLQAWLSGFGVVTQPEVRFGRYLVDLYDQANHVAYEADGAYWHDKVEAERPGYYARRDQYLASRFNLKVVRFSDAQIDAMSATCTTTFVAS